MILDHLKDTNSNAIKIYLLFAPTSLHQMLRALGLCGASLDDYLHLLVPSIVKAFETQTNHVDVRRWVGILKYVLYTLIK